MPIANNTSLQQLPALMRDAIAAYNEPGSRTSGYNEIYQQFIAARQAGIVDHGSVPGWIQNGNAIQSIHALLAAFGMNAQGSVLVGVNTLAQTLTDLPAAPVDWIVGISLPLQCPPCNINNPQTQQSLSTELGALFDTLSAPGAVTQSGGFVVASKTLHCLFPNIAPMIDGRHSGLSYYHILRDTYTPPLSLANWADWLGEPLHVVPNPSPRGAGRDNWDSARFLAAIGINQHIYELWQQHNGHPGLPSFLALDLGVGSSGIPRIIDKLLW